MRDQRGALLTPEQQAAYHHGSSQLYLQLKQEVDAQLQKFEQYALETCLHVPAGLLLQPVSMGPGWARGCRRVAREVVGAAATVAQAHVQPASQ